MCVATKEARSDGWQPSSGVGQFVYCKLWWRFILRRPDLEHAAVSHPKWQVFSVVSNPSHATYMLRSTILMGVQLKNSRRQEQRLVNIFLGGQDRLLSQDCRSEGILGRVSSPSLIDLRAKVIKAQKKINLATNLRLHNNPP